MDCYATHPHRSALIPSPDLQPGCFRHLVRSGVAGASGGWRDVCADVGAGPAWSGSFMGVG